MIHTRLYNIITIVFIITKFKYQFRIGYYCSVLYVLYLYRLFLLFAKSPYD